MNYQLKILKTEPNPNYKEELALYEKQGVWSRSIDTPSPKDEFVRDVLIVELTEEQYKKVKEEVIKVF